MNDRFSIAVLVPIMILGFSLKSNAQGCGTTVYDTGGPNGNYANNQNLSWTYCPPAGQMMTINFTAFSLENNWDNLSIHNGPTNTSPLIGSYSGTTLPPSFTGPVGGCITLWFTSDNNVTRPGWAATLTCAAPPTGDCIYMLNLFDSFGDGWGSSAVGVSINGSPYQYHTVTGASNQVLIGVNIGDLVTLNYNNSGTWQGDNSYTLSLQSGGGSLFSSGNPPAAGVVYSQTVDCEPPPAPPEDCIGSTTICNNQNFNNNASGTGAVADLTLTTAGCLASTEQQGTWYTFSPSTAGTIAFSINPTNPADDYDFAVWGPYPPGSNTSTICPPSSPPIRCSWAAPSGSTGLNYTATDLSEGAGGDKWVRFLTVTVGQVYVLYISNWSQSGTSFTLNWNLGSGASLDCTVLPVELIAFDAEAIGTETRLTWATASETNSDHFSIERSRDGEDFHRIGSVAAAGSSSSMVNYEFIDHVPFHGINYYRLQQVDADGSMDGGLIDHVTIGSRKDLAYPNPTDGILHVALPAGAEGLVRYNIHDVYGRVVQTGGYAMAAGASIITMELHALATGSYLIELIQPNGEKITVAPVIRY